MFFSNSNIYTKDWLDTVFAHRNQAYGAYELRQMSARATNLALGIVTVVVITLCSLAYAAAEDTPVVSLVDEEQIITVELDDSPIVELANPPTPPQEATADQAQQVAQDVPAQDLIRYTEIAVTNREAVTEEIDASNVILDKKKMPANITMAGVRGGTLVPKGTFGASKREGGVYGVSEGSITGDPHTTNEAHVFVEIMPEPVDGMEAFVKWVAGNYDFPRGALDNGTVGLIQIAFVVEKDGSLSSFEVVRDMGYNTGEAAIRLLKKAKKWNPGIQNGRPVRVAFTLPIRLQVNY